MRLTALTFLLLVLHCFCALAQSGPDFRCILSGEGRDSLVWNNVPLACGTYERTQIQRRAVMEESWTVVRDTADADLTGLAVPSDGSVYFYRICYVGTGCSGQPCSRELRSGSLAPPEFVHVSVEDGSLFVRWNPSSSAQVSSYIVFEDDGTDLVVVDTVAGTELELLDLTGAFVENPELSDRRFLVVSRDDCGNLSPRSTIVSGIRGIFNDVDSCVAQVEISTISLAVPVTPTFQVFASLDGGPYLPHPEPSTRRYNDLPVGSRACFYVERQPAGYPAPIRSTTVCTTIGSRVVNDVPLELYGVEVGDDGILSFAFNPATAPPDNPELFVEQIVEGGEVVRGIVGEAAVALAFNPLPLSPIGGSVAGRYRFETIDACGRELTSNEVAPVVLSGQSLVPGRNLLNWTPLVNGLPGQVTYDLLRVDTSGGETLAAFALDEREYADEVPGRSGTVCYRVVARYFPEGESVPVSFRSNLICLTGDLNFYLPNALNPGSFFAENRAWRPLFSGDFTGTDYALRIFDRWGGLVFETSDPLAAWAGTRGAGGEAAPAGTYLFAMSFTDRAGRSIVRSGDINLLR